VVFRLNTGCSTLLRGTGFKTTFLASETSSVREVSPTLDLGSSEDTISIDIIESTLTLVSLITSEVFATYFCSSLMLTSLVDLTASF